MEKDPNLAAFLFHALHHAHHTAVQAELSALDLEGLGSPLLMMLLQSRRDNGDIPAQRELADAMRVSPAAVAMSLKSLERLGYVQKRVDPADQRRKRITVTPLGEAAVEKCWTALQSIDRRMLEGFTARERTQLEALHRRMLRNLTGAQFPENPFERMECQCSKP